MSIQEQNAQGAKLAGLFVRRPVLAVVINALAGEIEIETSRLTREAAAARRVRVA